MNTWSSCESISASGLAYLHNKIINYIRSTEANKSIYELLIKTVLRIQEGRNIKCLFWGECRQEVENVRGTDRKSSSAMISCYMCDSKLSSAMSRSTRASGEEGISRVIYTKLHIFSFPYVD